MKVYRVQNRRGFGPYRDPEMDGLGSHQDVWAECRHEHASGRPAPSDTGLVTRVMRYCKHRRLLGDELYSKMFKFGFTSLNEVNRWFSKVELDVLKDAGFHVVKVKAKVSFADDYQCMFL